MAGIDFPPQWHLSPPSLGQYVVARSHVDHDIQFVVGVSRIETASESWLEYDAGEIPGRVGDERSRDWLWFGPLERPCRIPAELLEAAKKRAECSEI